MLAIESIINYYQEEKNTNAPEGFCPNCWGHQKYEGEFLEAVEHENIDLKNLGEKKGWIQAYVSSKLDGIRLKKSKNGVTCNSCSTEYTK
ncbi:MAG: hypothetical protein ACPG6V_03945 [Flavobacteriales bacterium]